MQGYDNEVRYASVSSSSPYPIAATRANYTHNTNSYSYHGDNEDENLSFQDERQYMNSTNTTKSSSERGSLGYPAKRRIATYVIQSQTRPSAVQHADSRINECLENWTFILSLILLSSTRYVSE